MLSTTADISYNIASKHDVQMSKRLPLLGAEVPQNPYWGSTPGPHREPRFPRPLLLCKKSCGRPWLS